MEQKAKNGNSKNKETREIRKDIWERCIIVMEHGKYKRPTISRLHSQQLNHDDYASPVP
jgi:hypothetical protein